MGMAFTAGHFAQTIKTNRIAIGRKASNANNPFDI
jgi:hypothetical protein